MMLCESPAVLEEVLQELGALELTYQRIGPRAIVAPSWMLERLRRALNQRGIHPRVVGAIMPELEEPSGEAP